VPVRVNNGVNSLILLPQPNGDILEVGTRVVWQDPPDFEGVDEFTRSDKVTPRPVFEPTEEHMQQVMDNTSADYCLFWEYKAREKRLVYAAHHSADGKLMTRSKEVDFAPGFACVGSAWVDPTFRLVRDSTSLGKRTFLRADMINE
jgi:hypothetical protein